MKTKMKIAIEADLSRKTELIEWSYANKKILEQHTIIAHDANADILHGVLLTPVIKLSPVANGGIGELEKMLEQKEIDILIFFPSINEQSVSAEKFQALLNLAAEQNIIIAFNKTTADLVLQNLASAKEIAKGYELDIAALKGIG
jgi:methylglyoxal synthase